MKIHILAKTVAERIAAGEVVEWPALGAKELNENTIVTDAREGQRHDSPMTHPLIRFAKRSVDSLFSNP